MTDREMVRLEAGSVVALRMYDVGEAVDLDAFARAAGGDVERPQFPSAPAAGLRYARRPVELTLDDVEVPLEDGRVFADVTVRVFDFGIAVVALRVLVGGLDWDRFSERVEQIGHAVAGKADAWGDVEERVRAALKTGRLRLEGDAVARHVFVIARRFGAPLPIDALVEEDYAPSIVSREWHPLTAMARADLLRGAYSSGSDLAVIGDDRTFITEPVAGSGVPDAVEAALAQRAFYDLARASAGDRANGRGVGLARVRLSHADTLVSADRSGRLAGVYATARDRFRVGEAEASADRGLTRAAGGGAGAKLSWLPMIVVALLAAIATAVVFVYLGVN